MAAVSLVEGVRVRRSEVPPVCREPFEVVEGEDVLERRELVGNRLDLGELRRVLADDRDRFGVREEVADVTR